MYMEIFPQAVNVQPMEKVQAMKLIWMTQQAGHKKENSKQITSAIY